MPIARYALAAAAACLLGGAAFAQPTDTTSNAPMPDASAAPTTDNSAAPMSGDQGMSQTPAPADQSMPADTSAPTGSAANTSATVDASGTQVIASQPVPDTPANRKAYGAPISHAGKRTQPAGN